MSSIIQDARFALRMMARAPAFTAAALLMIALGTGANAAMFSVIDAVMLHNPFVDPDRIGLLHVVRADNKRTTALSLNQYRSLLDSAPAFDAIGAMGVGTRPTLSGLGELRKMNVECVTAGAFRVLGTAPQIGRTFTAQEDRPGGPAAIILSYDFWQREFGGGEEALGRTLTLNGVPTTIVGVMPRRFLGPLSRNNNDGWLPLGPALDPPGTAGCMARSAVNAFVRVRADLTLDSAAAQANVTAGIGNIAGADGKLGARLGIESLSEHAVFDYRTPLFVLLAAVGLVLIIGCANVANLQLERAIGRRHEAAIRVALGATRGRMIRQALTENVLLYAAGAAAGLLLASWTLRLIVGLLPATVPHVREIALNLRVLISAFAAALATGLVVGITPVLQAASRGPEHGLRSSTRASTHGGTRARRVMVAGQIALSLALLVGAMLMVRTFITLRPSNPGFDPHDKLTAIVRLQGPSALGTRPNQFVDDVLERLARAPGVKGVSATTYVPMSGNVSSVDAIAGDLRASVWSGFVTPNFFDEMRIPIVRGRGFTPRDGAAAAPVAVINESFARRAWPDRDPLGATVTMKDFAGRTEVREVIGILRDFRSSGSDTRIRPELYIPFAQNPIGFINLIVRTDHPEDPRLRDTLRRAVAAVDPGQVADRIATYDEVLTDRVASWRLGAWLLGMFAALGVALAAIGQGASIAWWVTQRTQEIGVRMALGADPRSVRRLVLVQALSVATAGIVIGLAAAAMGTRFLAGWLYGVNPIDGKTFALCTAGMLVISAAASYLPARRATRIDPLAALRAE